MAFIFFDEFGTEPISYVGKAKTKKPTHRLFSTEITDFDYGVQIPHAIHKLNSGMTDASLSSREIVLSADGNFAGAIHKLKSSDIRRVNVAFDCGTYLDTPFTSRVLETPGMCKRK